MIKRALLLATFAGALSAPTAMAESPESMPGYCALESSELTTAQFLECRSLAKSQPKPVATRTLQNREDMAIRSGSGLRSGSGQAGIVGDASTIAPTDEVSGSVVEIPVGEGSAPTEPPASVQPVTPVTEVVPAPEPAATKSYDISFANSSSVIQPLSFAELDEIASEMNKYMTLSAVIEGHANRTGDWGFNKRLSVERAASVRSYLIARGVSASRLRSEGYSFDRPLPGTAPEAGINRRVELRIE